MVFRWFYISASRLAEDEADELVADIVKDSVPGNHRLHVTGALLFTGRTFAQYLEGPADAVGALQRLILDDLRHENIRTIAEGVCPHRRFVTWSLAYVIPDQANYPEVEELLREAAGDPVNCAEALARFMSETATMGRG